MAAARAVSVVGWPNEHLAYLPIILYSADFATRLDFKARSTISGPMPAQSPSVTPIRSFSLLMLLPVIVIEFAQPRTSVVATGRKSCRDVRTPQRGIPTMLQDRRRGVVGGSAYANCFAGSRDQTRRDACQRSM